MDDRLQAVIDKTEIIDVSAYTHCCRDGARWEDLANGFMPDAPVTTSWFHGTAREFALQSSKMMAGHPAGDTQRHVMSNAHVTLKGNRAVCEYYIILHQGRTMDDYEFDFKTWSVTLDLFQKYQGAWRVAKRLMIYEKDRIDPHVPGAVPQSYFDQLDLSRYPQPVRYHCYRNERSSGKPPGNLILRGTAAEQAARREATEWIA